MSEHSQNLPGTSDLEYLDMELRALSSLTQDATVKGVRRAMYLRQIDQARQMRNSVILRGNLMAIRPGLDLPYPEWQEEFRPYFNRSTLTAEIYDVERTAE